LGDCERFFIEDSPESSETIITLNDAISAIEEYLNNIPENPLDDF
jgi:hypothetical protein